MNQEKIRENPEKVLVTSGRWFDRPVVGYILMILTVVGAVWIASNQLSAAQVASENEAAFQRELNAYRTWERFTEISLENSDVSGPLPKGFPEKISVKYYWFIERFLIAGEQIVLSAKEDRQWELAVVYEIIPRYRWFLTEEFLGDANDVKSLRDSSYCTYISGLRALIREGVKEGYRQDADIQDTDMQTIFGINSEEDLTERFDTIDENCIHPDEPLESS